MKNKFDVRGDITAIFLNSPKYGPMETLISTEKLSRAMEYRGTWCAKRNNNTNNFYCSGNVRSASGKRSSILLHRWLTMAPENLLIDHFNHKTLDNSDENLRTASPVQNGQNRIGAGRNNQSSGIRGVSWDKTKQKWNAYLKLNGLKKNIGRFSSVQEAESAVKNARAKLMPYSQDAFPSQLAD